MQLKIEKGTFTNHSLEDVADALKKGLSENFKNVEGITVELDSLFSTFENTLKDFKMYKSIN